MYIAPGLRCKLKEDSQFAQIHHIYISETVQETKRNWIVQRRFSREIDWLRQTAHLHFEPLLKHTLESWRSFVFPKFALNSLHSVETISSWSSPWRAIMPVSSASYPWPRPCTDFCSPLKSDFVDYHLCKRWSKDSPPMFQISSLLLRGYPGRGDCRPQRSHYGL